MKKYQPTVLILLDGWGFSTKIKGNTIEMAKPKFYNWAWNNYPKFLLDVKNEAPDIRQNFINYASLGSGRKINSDNEDLNLALSRGFLYRNKVLQKALHEGVKNNATIHVVVPIEKNDDHCIKLLENFTDMAKNLKINRIAIHIILSGKNDYKDIAKKLNTLDKYCQESRSAVIATLTGCEYTQEGAAKTKSNEALEAQTNNRGPVYKNIADCLNQSKKKGYNLKEIPPCIIKNKYLFSKAEHEIWPVKKKDLVFFLALDDAYFNKNMESWLDKKIVNVQNIYGLVDFGLNNTIKSIFTREKIDNCLSSIIDDNNLNQLSIADNEVSIQEIKYFHGGLEANYRKEDRIFYKTGDKGDQSIQLAKINERLIRALNGKKYNFIVVGLNAIAESVKISDINHVKDTINAVDSLLKRAADIVLKLNGRIIICSSYGLAEDLTNGSSNPVGIIFISNDWSYNLIEGTFHKEKDIGRYNRLKDDFSTVAPTILDIMGLERPKEMTGKSLMGSLGR